MLSSATAVAWPMEMTDPMFQIENDRRCHQGQIQESHEGAADQVGVCLISVDQRCGAGPADTDELSMRLRLLI